MNTNSAILICLGFYLLLLTSPTATAAYPKYEIAVIQVAKSTKLKQRYINSISKASSDLSSDFKGINASLRFSATSPPVKFEVYDIDTGENCVSSHPEQIKQLQNNALLILGPVTSDCANAFINAKTLHGIPILNSLSTLDGLTQEAYSNNPGWFFRTASADQYRITRLIDEVKRANNLPDLRSLNFGFIFDSSSEFSRGLLTGTVDGFKQLRVLDEEAKLSDTTPVMIDMPALEQRVKLFDIQQTYVCEAMSSPIHNLLIFMYSAAVQTLVEQINACHHQQGFAQPRYFAVGNPEAFEFLPKNSMVISTPNLEQFENTNTGLRLDNSSAYSSTTYIAVEALAQSVSQLHATNQPLSKMREVLRNSLAATQFTSMLANQNFQFNRLGDIESALPHASVYRMKTDYILVNQLKSQDSIFRLVNVNELDNIGWFDGDLLMKILVPSSYKEAVVDVNIERVTDFKPCVPFTDWCWDLSYANNSYQVAVSNGIISTYQHTPLFPGKYTIHLRDKEQKRVSNLLTFQVTYPKHLLITFFVAGLVGLLLMEQTLANAPHKKLEHRRYFGGILLTAFILHLFSVTFRNSDIASFLPFLSFSTNLITNAIIIGVLAGFNGLELIRLFVSVLQARFFPKQAQTGKIEPSESQLHTEKAR